MDIAAAHTRELKEPVRQLLFEYADVMGIPRVQEEFLRELVDLPGEYAPPGCLLVAYEAGHLAGCVACAPEGDDSARVRRFYVREEYRGRGVEKGLLRAAADACALARQTTLRLDPAVSVGGVTEPARELGFEDSSGELVLELEGREPRVGL